jgi:hypothetical protein
MKAALGHGAGGGDGLNVGVHKGTTSRVELLRNAFNVVQRVGGGRYVSDSIIAWP